MTAPAMYQQVNLYQPIFRKQRQIFSAVTMAQAAGVVAVALVGFYVYGLWQVLGLEAEVVQLEGREKAFTAQLARIDPTLTSNRRAEVEQELKKLNATLLDQQRLIDVLRDQPLGTTEGFSGYLAALGRQHKPELWLTELAINGGTRALELTGRSVRAELVPEYLQTLGREPALAGQKFDKLEIGRDESEVTFHATSRAATEKDDGPIQARQRP
jgi:Tfp pilus assembly protein PilN